MTSSIWEIGIEGGVEQPGGFLLQSRVLTTAGTVQDLINAKPTSTLIG